MYSFLDLNEVEDTLEFLDTQEQGPFVQKLPVQAGKKEARYGQLLGGEWELEEPSDAQPVIIQAGPSRNERVEQLEEEVIELRAEVDQLKSDFAKFKEQFE